MESGKLYVKVLSPRAKYHGIDIDVELGNYIVPLHDFQHSKIGSCGTTIIVSKYMKESKKPIHWDMVSVSGLFGCIGGVGGRFKVVKFVNVLLGWDYRFNSVLAYFVNRSWELHFDKIYGKQYVYCLHASVFDGNSEVAGLKVDCEEEMDGSQAEVLFHSVSRMLELEHLAIGCGFFHSAGNCIAAFASKSLQELRSLKCIELIRYAFEDLGSDATFFDVLDTAITVSQVKTVIARSERQITPYGRNNFRRWYLGISKLIDMVCDTKSFCLERLHFRMVHLMPSGKEVRQVCKHLTILDLEHGFQMDAGDDPERAAGDDLYFRDMTSDLLKLFPNLVVLRMHYCYVYKLDVFAEYILGAGSQLQELLLEYNDIGVEEYRAFVERCPTFGNLRVLSLHANPLEARDVDRKNTMVCIGKSKLENFPFSDRHGGQMEWQDIHWKATGMLCCQQFENLIAEIEVTSGMEQVPFGLWANLLLKAGSMGHAKENIFPWRKMYYGMMKTRRKLYLGSNTESIVSDRQSVLFSLVSGRMAMDNVLTGGTVTSREMEERARRLFEQERQKTAPILDAVVVLEDDNRKKDDMVDKSWKKARYCLE